MVQSGNSTSIRKVWETAISNITMMRIKKQRRSNSPLFFFLFVGKVEGASVVVFLIKNGLRVNLFLVFLESFYCLGVEKYDGNHSEPCHQTDTDVTQLPDYIGLSYCSEYN